MDQMPREPEAFTERVRRLFAERFTQQQVRITGPLELTIDNRQVGLEDLYRALQTGREDAETILQRFLDAYEQSARLEQTPIPFEVAAPRILPRIKPLTFFRDHKPDFYATQPFINDTVILYMIDFNGTVTPVTTEQLIRWGVTVEQLDELARQNLARHEPDLELKVFRADDAAAALFTTGDGYDASRLLLEQLHGQLAPELGRDFLAAIPTRDVFIAFPTGPDQFVRRLKQRIQRDYKLLPHPITDDLFLVTLDGVADWRPAA